MRYVCIAKCFWRGQRYNPGETADLDEPCKHFRPAPAGAPDPVVAPEQAPGGPPENMFDFRTALERARQQSTPAILKAEPDAAGKKRAK